MTTVHLTETFVTHLDSSMDDQSTLLLDFASRFRDFLMLPCRAPLTYHYAGLLTAREKSYLQLFKKNYLLAVRSAHCWTRALLTDGARTSAQRPRDEQKNQSGKQQPLTAGISYPRMQVARANLRTRRLHARRKPT